MAQLLKDVLVKVIEDLQDRRDSDPVAAAWQHAIDNKTRLHARPLGIKQKTLRVIVDSSAWLYHLRLQKKRILRKMKSQGLEIDDIAFRVGKID